MLNNCKNLNHVKNIFLITSRNKFFKETLKISCNNLCKITSSSIVLVHPFKLYSRSLGEKVARLGKSKERLRNFKNNYSQKSSSNNENVDNDKKDKSNSNKTNKDDEFSVRQKIFSIALFLFGVYEITKLIKSQTISSELSYSEFLNRILPSGCVNKIVILPELQNAYIFTFANVKLDDGTFPKPIYSIGVNNITQFENSIRKYELENGIDPLKGVQIEYQNPSNYLRTILLMSFIGLIMFSIMLLRKNKGNLSQIMQNPLLPNFKMKIFDSTNKAENLNIKFKDIAGLHEAKVEIMEFVDYLKNSSKYTKLGAKLPKGAILTGPPGCGKTLLAKALATECNVPFININGSEFIEMIGGLGASRVRDLFKEAKKRAPCIIYIDEIDAIGKKRDENSGKITGSNSEREQTLNQLLVEMDGITSTKEVVLIASTNRLEVLDKALLRPGRFDRHISIDMPTILERKELFELYLKKIKLDKSPSFYSGRLAQLTANMSGADIANIVNEAAINAVSNKKDVVTEKELSYSLDRVTAGPAKKSQTLIQEEKEIVAYHEAGHALVGWLLKHTDALLKVSIVPRTSAALGFAQYSLRDRKLFTTEELFERMCMMLGGRAAENVYFNRITTGAQDDLKKVTDQAYAQVKIFGMSEKVGPLCFPPDSSGDNSAFAKKPYGSKLARIIDDEASAIVTKAYFTTEKLIRDNFDKLNILAKELLAKETLTYEDVKKLIGPPPYGDKDMVEMVEQSLPNLEKKN
uniref:AAA domain-containing protein n=1 Tax=Strongyloides stercoralis TaxID=6248 RepID=A0A0K0DTJ8_STRER